MELKKYKMQEHFDQLERKLLKLQREVEAKEKHLDQRQKEIENEQEVINKRYEKQLEYPLSCLENGRNIDVYIDSLYKEFGYTEDGIDVNLSGFSGNQSLQQPSPMDDFQF